MFDVSTTNQVWFFCAAIVVASSACVGSPGLDDPDDLDGGAGILDGAAGDGDGGAVEIVGIIQPGRAGAGAGDGDGDGDGRGVVVDGGAQAPPACDCDGEPLPEEDGDGLDLPHCNGELTAMVVAAVACVAGECQPATTETPCDSECDPGNDFIGVPPRCR